MSVCPIHPRLPRTSNGNNGHGWVFPRPDGMKTRCGGPAICSECAKDQARKYASEHEPHVPLSTYESAVKGRQAFRKAYVGARQLLKRFVDAWEGVPGHENMDRLCEIARGLLDDSGPAPETLPVDGCILPCDVKVGNTTIKAGLPVSTVLKSIRVHAQARTAFSSPTQKASEGRS